MEYPEPTSYSEWVEFTSTLTTEQAASLVKNYRDRARDDVLFLAREILCYDWVDYDLPYHMFLAKQAMCLTDSLTLTPRSFIKSTIITISGTIWYLLNFPEHCVLIVSNKEKNAGKFLRAIADHFRKEDSPLRFFFPEFCPQMKKEEPTSEAFTLPNRKRPRPENSIEIVGITGSMAGRHYERIVVDDMVHEQNVPPKASEEVLSIIWESFKAQDSLLRAGVQEGHPAHRVVVGTRWHDGDAYGRILTGGDDEDMSITKMYSILIAEPYGNLWYSKFGDEYCYEDSPILSSNSSLLWPDRFPKEYLDTLRAKRGEYHWACNMSQDPLPPDSAVRFNKEWLKPVKLENVRLSEFNLAITVDGAFNEASTRADRSAIVLTGVPPGSGIYIFATDAGKYTPFQIAERIIAMWSAWKNVLWVGIECDSGGKVIYNTVKSIIDSRGLNISLRELWTQGIRKDARVAQLQAFAQREGLFYSDKVDPGHISEILRFPVGRYRDIPDAVAYRALNLSKPTSVTKKAKIEWKQPEILKHKGSDIIKSLRRRTTGRLRRII